MGGPTPPPARPDGPRSSGGGTRKENKERVRRGHKQKVPSSAEEAESVSIPSSQRSTPHSWMALSSSGVPPPLSLSWMAKLKASNKNSAAAAAAVNQTGLTQPKVEGDGRNETKRTSVVSLPPLSPPRPLMLVRRLEWAGPQWVP